MNISVEKHAHAMALFAALVSLGGMFLISVPIRLLDRTAPSPRAVASESSSDHFVQTVDRVRQGRQLFTISCSECHGDNARGDEGPDLHALSISNSRIKNTILRGIKDEMPSFGKKYDDSQVNSLIAYLRSLN